MIVAATTMAVVVSAVLLMSPGRTPGHAPAISMDGRPVELDPGTTAVPREQSRAVDDTGAVFEVPSVGLSVPLGAIDETDGEITPPGYRSAYWVRNLGVSVGDARAGTVYVVMHALRGGGTAPGDYLTDVPGGRSTLHAGESVVVSGVRYSVTATTTVTKDELPYDAQVWADVPGRLVVITCLEKPDGSPSTQNMIVFAETT
ncbi:class F sortase [Microbacterium sp. SORGH_AS_0888]|uniref:class F sortase n=1 Tax=Microbacterium sp. SORGH_AS_0888 TaxID=3041791 RepID=UPI0027D8610F|nr:class F sortase [Microbacterium sp. SORGH_AS_0888]